MLKIAMLGIAGILTALFLKEVRPSYTVFISMANLPAVFILCSQPAVVSGGHAGKSEKLCAIQDSYLTQLLKIVGLPILP